MEHLDAYREIGPPVNQMAENILRSRIPVHNCALDTIEVKQLKDLFFSPLRMQIDDLVLLFGRRGFCYRGCWIYPIIAASTYIGRRLRVPSLHVAVQDKEACLDCKKCDRNCPMSIDVMTVVHNGGTFPNNCVQCGTCIDTCPKNVLTYRFGFEPFQSMKKLG